MTSTRREVVTCDGSTTATVVITQDTATVSFARADSSTIRLRTDSAKLEWTWPPSFETDVRAHWRDGTLQLERKVEDGPTVKEAFVRAPGSTRLIIATTIENALPQKLEYRRVYDLESTGSQ